MLSLLITLSVAYICIVIASFFISMIFAKYSIKPIKETFKKQKEFVADASHELKTPLTIIKADISILEDEDDLNDEQSKQWLYKIDNEINKMSKLITSMLTLAQNEQVKTYVLSTFSVSDCLENIITTIEVMIYEKKINLKTKIDKKIYIKSSKESFEQIITILLDNAIKYTPENEHINITLKKENSYVYVNILNTGVEFTESDLSNIFDRFYRADKSRNRSTENFGLGLSIAKTITENLRGSISVQLPSKNSICFSVKLPINKSL